MIKFNVPTNVGNEFEYIADILQNNKTLCGDGEYTKKCNSWLEEKFSCPKVLLTTSCTHALEMAAMLCDIKPGDEVIMPSYTFVSTANAFALNGAKVVFVDIRPDTMNINEELIEAAITDKTKVIVPVHYAGVSCNMEKIMKIANKYNLLVVEDAAQGVMSKYKGNFLGTIGDLGCYSFHETKNYTMGEGGAILINNKNMIERAEVIREKGTNRSKFFRGQIDKYSWVDLGSSYLPSELNAAYLFAQLEKADEINKDRILSWNIYNERLMKMKNEGIIEIPYIPDECEHNAHMFYIKVKDLNERSKMIRYLKDNGIITVFHYVPLHTSKAGRIYGKFNDCDVYTTKESDRLIRLPLYYKIERKDINIVCDYIEKFYK